jgi:tetrahedral aminopeptidase
MRLGADLLVARGLDNHAGAWAALEALRLLASSTRPAADVWAVGSVQEEIGLWGSITAAHCLEPAVALAIDVWHASDYPDADQRRLGATRLGGGPAISRGATVHPLVAEQLIAAAEAEGIPYSTRSAVRGDTEVAMSHVRDGCATGAIGIPTRYMHSPCETISLTDLNNVARLAAAFTRRVGEHEEWRR